MLVLPDVRVLSDIESKAMHQFNKRGGKLVITGHPDAKLNDLSKAVLYPDAPERAYLKSAETDFEHVHAETAADLFGALQVSSGVEVHASPKVVVHLAKIGKRQYLFLANFDGLKAGEIATPRAQSDVEVMLRARPGAHLHVLPFLGQESVLSGKTEGQGVRFTLPSLERGAVAWVE